MICKYAEIFCWKNVSSFCIAKATHIFSAKNIRILYIESAKIVNEMGLNKLVKLTMLWTTGPCSLRNSLILVYTVCIALSIAIDQRGYKVNNFLISLQKPMLWVLIKSTLVKLGFIAQLEVCLTAELGVTSLNPSAFMEIDHEIISPPEDYSLHSKNMKWWSVTSLPAANNVF